MATKRDHVDIENDDIQDDEKDWTWILERPCPECGFDAAATPAADVPRQLRSTVGTWRQALGHPDARRRPDPSTWSPVEYACHVRDVCTVFEERLRLMLEQDDPLFANWDQDATARAERYSDQDPATVTGELEAAAESIATRFETVTGSQWSRPGRRSNGSVFTVESLARYFLHDAVHHAHDVSHRES